MAKQKRAVVFVDGSNFYHGMQKGVGLSTSRLNFLKFSENLSSGKKLVQIRYYAAKIKQEFGNNRLYQGQRRFFARLEAMEKLVVRLGRMEKSGNVWREKAVDIMIAVDMLLMAVRDEYDVAYLLSADGDFTPVVEAVQDEEKKVIIASAVWGNELRRVADGFILLEEQDFSGCW